MYNGLPLRLDKTFTSPPKQERLLRGRANHIDHFPVIIVTGLGDFSGGNTIGVDERAIQADNHVICFS